jgi:crotonobetainyl-CoA:carnitine CoA-transferase CaiB-like acyl-CoA transferase
LNALPLTGVTVVSVEQAVAAPFATRQLADLGARVIKIERPDGGDFARGYDTTVNGLSSYFVWLNRSKESLTLDLKRPAGAEILARLVARADVFVQNLAPGAADRLGSSPARLRERHPRLIVCNVSGYGASGPYTGKKAYDLLVQSEVGLVSITDIAAGMYAYSGVLTALFARATTGVGASIDVSLFDALSEWMGQPAYYTGYGGTAPLRSGANHASIAPYGPFTAGDGGTIYLGIQNAREWTRFCADVLRRPELADDERFNVNPLRVRNRAALHATIESAFASLTTTEVIARLDAAGIAWARMNSVAAFLEHPQLTGRDRWREIGSPAGPLRAMIPPVSIDGVEPAMGDVPALGQHTELILEELGVARETIAAWRSEGAI